LIKVRSEELSNDIRNSSIQMGFDPCNRPLKIRESIRTLTLKVGTHLGVWRFIPSHSSPTPESMKYDSWASLLARTFTSPCLGQEPKVRVVTYWTMKKEVDIVEIRFIAL
jgi:hypothetical protein